MINESIHLCLITIFFLKYCLILVSALFWHPFHGYLFPHPHFEFVYLLLRKPPVDSMWNEWIENIGVPEYIKQKLTS